jgi:ABC-type branched-subunit amino acid transport system substrate-binding protein
MGLRKHILKFLLLTACIYSLSWNACAQSLETEGDKVRTINGKTVVVHVVQKKETSYGISKKYHISIEALLAANSGLAAEGLKVGQVIQIPVSDIEKPSDIVIPPGTLPPLYYSKPKKILSKDSLDLKTFKDSSFSISLLLPLHLFAETIHHAGKEENSADEAISPTSLMGLEFYEGFKMAADSLQKEGFKGSINIYDTSGDTNRVNLLLQKPEIKNSQMIMGPFAPVSAINRVASFAKDNAIVMVSPLTNNLKNLTENPFLIQITPSVKTQCRQMAEFIIDSFPNANIVILNANSSKDIELGQTFKSSLTALIKEHPNSTSKVTALNHADVSLKGVTDGLSLISRNVIIIPSSEEGFISVILSGLKAQTEKFKITLIGLPTWQKFETIDAVIFQELNTHIFNSFYIEEQSEACIRFRKKFRNLYKTEPSEFAYHGFDAGYYYIKALVNFGPAFQDFLPELKFTLMHTTADYERININGGYENQYISILKFDDFKLKKVNR